MGRRRPDIQDPPPCLPTCPGLAPVGLDEEVVLRSPLRTRAKVRPRCATSASPPRSLSTPSSLPLSPDPNPPSKRYCVPAPPTSPRVQPVSDAPQPPFLPGSTLCPRCGGFFRGSRGLAVHQRTCRGPLSAEPTTRKRARVTVAAGRSVQMRLDGQLHVVRPPPQPPPRADELPRVACPKCHKLFISLQRHLRFCAPELHQQPDVDSLSRRSAGGPVETVEHVLFDCPAIAALRPPPEQAKKKRRQAAPSAAS